MQTDANALKFAGLSPVYDGLMHWLPFEPHQKLAKMTTQAAPRTILDLCTGTGYTARLLARIHPQAIISGVDISRDMLGVARARARDEGFTHLEFSESDASHLPFADAYFDAATISFAMHELPTAIRTAAIREVRRVLKPSGYFYLVDVDRPGVGGFLTDAYLSLFEPPHAAEVLGEKLARLLEAGGFSVLEKHSGFAGFYQFLIAQPAG